MEKIGFKYPLFVLLSGFFLGAHLFLSRLEERVPLHEMVFRSSLHGRVILFGLIVFAMWVAYSLLMAFIFKIGVSKSLKLHAPCYWPFFLLPFYLLHYEFQNFPLLEKLLKISLGLVGAMKGSILLGLLQSRWQVLSLFQEKIKSGIKGMGRIPERLNHEALLPLIILLGLALRLVGIGFGLPFDKFHPDENYTVYQALGYLNWSQGLDLNPHDFTHPAFHQYLLAMLYLLVFFVGWLFGTFQDMGAFEQLYHQDPTLVYMVGRGLSVVAGSLTIVMTYLIGRRLFNKGVGIIAAFLLSISFIHVNYSHFLEPTATLTLLVAIAMYFFVLLMEEGKLSYYFMGCLFGGLAMAAKYNGGVIVLSFLAAHMLYCWGRKVPLEDALINRRLVLGLLIIAGGFFIGSPYCLLDFSNFWHHFVAQFTWETGQPRAMDLANASFDWNEIGYISYIKNILPWGLGWPLVILCFSGLLCALVRHGKEDILLLSFPLTYYLIAGSTRSPGTARHIVPILPFLMVFGAMLLFMMVDRLVEKPKREKVLGASLALLCIVPLGKALAYDYFISLKDTRLQAEEWIEENLPEGATILFESYTPGTSTVSRESKLAQKFNLVKFSVGGRKSLRTYLEEGVDYVVFSSLRYKRYFSQSLPDSGGLEPKTAENYILIANNCQLLKAFYPHPIRQFLKEDEAGWGETWPHHPTIKIYKLQVPDDELLSLKSKFLLARASVERGMFEEAEALMEAIPAYDLEAIEGLEGASLCALVGLLKDKRGKSEEAMAQLEKALALDGGESMAHYLLAKALGKRARWGLALEHLKALEERFPQSDFLMMRLAEASYFSEEMERAIAYASRISDHRPSANFLLAMASLGLSRWEEARQYLESLRADSILKGEEQKNLEGMIKTIEDSPKGPFLHGQLSAYFFAKGYYQEALVEAQIYFTLTHAPMAHYLKGRAYLGLNLFEEAQRELLTFTQGQPEAGYGYYYLGVALLGTEDEDGARAMLKKGAQMDPRYEESAMALIEEMDKKAQRP